MYLDTFASVKIFFSSAMEQNTSLTEKTLWDLSQESSRMERGGRR